MAKAAGRVEKAPGADWTAIYQDRDTGLIERMLVFGQESVLDALFETVSSFGLFDDRKPSECIEILAMVRIGFTLSDIPLLNHATQDGYTIIYQSVATGVVHTEQIHTIDDIRSMLSSTKFKSVPDNVDNPLDFIDVIAVAKLNLSHEVESHL